MEKQNKHIKSSHRDDKKMNLMFRIGMAMLILIVIFFVTLYIFVPTYRFNDPKPFEGKFIYNPYQDTVYNWKYLDLRNESNGSAPFSVYEYGYGIFPTRYLCLDYQSRRKIDYPFFQNIHFKQYNINCLSKECALVALAHPVRGFKLREMKHLDNYRVMEVISPLGNAFDYWDLALSSGHRVNILATYSDSGSNDFISQTVVNYIDDSEKSLTASLRDGDAYAVSYKKGTNDLPELKSITLNNDTVIVEATKKIKEVRFIGQNGVVKDSLYDVNQGVYAFKDDDSYIRIELCFDDETYIYLNPIVRHEFQYFFDPVSFEMMKERTWLMRIVYILVLLFFAKYLLFNKKEEK